MPELATRDQHENALARALGKAGTAAARAFEAAVAAAGDTQQLAPDVWDEIASAYSGALLGELESIYLDGALGQQAALGIGVDFDVVNQQAADFARQHTFNLVRNITDNSRATLQQAVSDYFQQQMTLGDLQARIRRTFGPVRAAQISITETTRAQVEGERAVVRELERQGITFTHIFHSVNDGRVCPICEPLDGKPVTVYPPVHVGCRCFVTSEPVRVEA